MKDGSVFEDRDKMGRQGRHLSDHDSTKRVGKTGVASVQSKLDGVLGEFQDFHRYFGLHEIF